MGEDEIRAALERHWAASEAGDDDAEDAIYHDDAVLEYPPVRRALRGRLAIRTTRALLPDKHFTIRRVLGHGDVWVTEYVYQLRWEAVLHCEHHGVQGRQSLSRDAVFRRPVQALARARPLG